MSEQIYGIHAVQSLLEQSSDNIEKIAILTGKPNARLQSILDNATRLNITVIKCTRDELDQMVACGKHQGVVAYLLAEQQAVSLEQLLKQKPQPFLLVLDGIQDPHNLGACLRVADAAGVDAVIAPKDRAVQLTPTVRKVACGAAETVPFIAVTNLSRTLQQLQAAGIWVFGAAGEAEESLYQVKLTRPIALVLGAEGSGLRRLTRDGCDQLLRIPMCGTVDSLNVSVAAGIFCFEVVRQSHTT
ncbi:MAG: 23S rRNA (guanosine(2251)-2'-O)-methyltransferase RlmB [Pseudomonadota bacterium]|nr:23S rRNA (guanosine(2251)-2'-O)-methyltransferase RlmB [Pseudomonadota bacterium]